MPSIHAITLNTRSAEISSRRVVRLHHTRPTIIQREFPNILRHLTSECTLLTQGYAHGGDGDDVRGQQGGTGDAAPVSYRGIVTLDSGQGAHDLLPGRGLVADAVVVVVMGDRAPQLVKVAGAYSRMRSGAMMSAASTR
ncbi:hypothetical protein ACFVKB_47190 [Rhodococcus sp. NPDC127530]|uniref:hypothetical protein n=1 Tax=unclassified Rhodococcus (in: high G+C Gram-positive bacteria) TaxID=192944 RepID=UPI0036326949